MVIWPISGNFGVDPNATPEIAILTGTMTDFVPENFETKPAHIPNISKNI